MIEHYDDLLIKMADFRATEAMELCEVWQRENQDEWDELCEFGVSLALTYGEIIKWLESHGIQIYTQGSLDLHISGVRYDFAVQVNNSLSKEQALIFAIQCAFDRL